MAERASSRSLTVGLISDTHGLMRPEALDALRGTDHIVHAGDIGKPEILDALRELAPVTAVRGNNDTTAWAASIPETTVLEIGGTRIYVLHDLKTLELDAAGSGYDAVVAGHSHRAAITERDGVLFVNPGSAGPRRFNLAVAVGFLEIRRGRMRARIRELS